MRRRTFLWAACLVFAGNAAASDAPSAPGPSAAPAAAVQASKPLNGRMKQEAQERLSAALVNKQIKSRIVFPAYKDGVDLAPSGMWSLHQSKELIEDHGIGVEQGGTATITAVKLRDKHIEFHLDGGGAGIFSEGFGPDPSEEKGKVPSGSRINLRFDRAITSGDLSDLQRLVTLLEPVADTAELRAQLAATLPAPAPPVAAAPAQAPPAKAAPAAPQPVATMAGMGAPGLIDPKAGSAKAAPAKPADAKAADAKAAPVKPATPPASAPVVAAPVAAAPVATTPKTVSPAPSTTAAPKPEAKKATAKDIASIKISAGMDKRAVFELLGQPGYKRVDVSKEVPVEMWQYNLAGESKRIITFENGVVLKVEDF